LTFKKWMLDIELTGSRVCPMYFCFISKAW
jgi:hypothetical protein